MKKKLVLCLLITTMAFEICACGSSNNSQGNNENTVSSDVATEKETEANDASTKETETESSIPTVTIGEDLGQGTMYIATPSGTSENENVPVFYVGEGTVYTELGFNTTEIDGSKLSYIYVDGEFNCKEQLADAQISVGLEGTALIVGTHVVELKQFENNDESGTLTTYKFAKYEVKSE